MFVSEREAALALSSGDLVALPTETVYGIAAKFDDENAVNNIFLLKKRPQSNPLIIHVSDVQDIFPLIEGRPDYLETLATKFWPGPLTLILPIIPHAVPANVRACLPTAAFRIPNHPKTLNILSKTGPLVMPSANLSGKPSATCPKHIQDDFGNTLKIVDGGHTNLGIESTILYYHKGLWKILRRGALPKEAFQDYFSHTQEPSMTKKTLCPGTHYKHYSPKATLHLNLPTKTTCTVLGFIERQYPSHNVRFLGSENTPKTVAKNLYNTLRKLDEDHIEEAFIDMHFPKTGLWETIRERLVRASQKI